MGAAETAILDLAAAAPAESYQQQEQVLLPF
jgi:hypothetical protein